MIDENRAREIAKDTFDENLTNSQFGVGPIPYHVHTGVDSPQISYLNILDIPVTPINISTAFETATRFTTTNVAGGAVIYDANGLNLQTSITPSSSTSTLFKIDPSNHVFLGSPTFTLLLYGGNLTDLAGLASSFFGLGQPTVSGAGHVYTVAHAGFKILKSGSVYTLYATQADGTTENASSALTTLSNADVIEMIIEINGTSSISYFWRKNGGNLSLPTNLVNNMPTSSTEGSAQFSASNNGTGNFTTVTILGATYTR